MQIHVWGIRGLPEVLPGDDLAELVAAAAPDLRDGDVLVVTSKVVSKAEGRLLEVRPEPAERERARQDAVEAETVRVVAERGATRIVVTRHGLVLAAAGVDASNLPPDRIALLPEDPDASARAIREGLRERLGVTVAVLVSDTFGRPWRQGVADVAVGAAGFPVLHDLRGRSDGYGNPLQMTQVAVADEVAAAADLVKGKLSGTPVAVVRGLVFEPPSPDPGAAASIRPAEEDLFPLGTVQARRTLLARPPWAQPTAVRPAPGGPEAAGRAVAAVRAAVAGAPPLRVLTGGEAADVLAPLVRPAGWSGTDTATAGCVVVLEAADDQDGAVTAVAAHHLALALRAEGCAGVLVQAPGAPGRHTVVAVVAADGTDDADRPTAPGPPT